jgi:hypothetical protein
VIPNYKNSDDSIMSNSAVLFRNFLNNRTADESNFISLQSTFIRLFYINCTLLNQKTMLVHDLIILIANCGKYN